VTDADLVLGYLDPGFFLGGRMSLDLEGARRAIGRRIAEPLGMTVEEAAWGIHQVVNESMANAARVHVLERGKDPERLPVFAFGGAGPVHAYRITQALGARELIVPLGAGVISSLGFLAAPLAFDFVRSWRAALDGLDWSRARELFAEMAALGRALLERSGVASPEIVISREADMRYVGQGHEIRVAVSDAALAGRADLLRSGFESTYETLYGRLGPPVGIEIVNWRLIASGPRPEVHLELEAPSGKPAEARKGSRAAYFPEAGRYLDTPVYDRYRLGAGAELLGPAIIEERESTLIVGPDAQVRADRHGNLVVHLP